MERHGRSRSPEYRAWCSMISSVGATEKTVSQMKILAGSPGLLGSPSAKKAIRGLGDPGISQPVSSVRAQAFAGTH